MKRIDLSTLSWTLQGWQPNARRMPRSMEIDHQILPQIGPLPVRVTGSVQAALLEAGLIRDWNIGLQSRECEWIERRDWEFSTILPADWVEPGQPLILDCQGLDHEGVILLDNQFIADMPGCLLPIRVELTQALRGPHPHRLRLIFTGAPCEQGQIGYTSHSKHFKPRFAYQWDWCPRIVALGIWDRLHLEVGASPRLTHVRPMAQLLANNASGMLSMRCHLFSPVAADCQLEACLFDHGLLVARQVHSVQLNPGASLTQVEFDPIHPVAPWQPNGMGTPVLYELQVNLLDSSSTELDCWQGRVGFKRVAWLPCDAAPEDALPWICEINGREIFLQGINWTPIRPNYHDLTREDYAHRLGLYAEAGFNLMRCWGGGLIERADFYELCDELGLLVWQEFPLSSSALDNTPPSDTETIEHLLEIAASAIERRAGHASLLLWCGGNELQSSTVRSQPGCGWPWDETHPCLRALGELVRNLHPGVRFLPTSAFGPSFQAHSGNFGRQLHHNVHGPWQINGTLDDWQEYWAADDALFRAELGVASAQPLDLMLAFKGSCELWPPSNENPYWCHPGAWWIDWERFRDQLPPEGGLSGVKAYIHLSQQLQAEALHTAVASCKARFPRCGGFILWMGHDCFPCAVNTSIVDFWGRPKPALTRLRPLLRTAVEPGTAASLGAPGVQLSVASRP